MTHYGTCTFGRSRRQTCPPKHYDPDLKVVPKQQEMKEKKKIKKKNKSKTEKEKPKEKRPPFVDSDDKDDDDSDSNDERARAAHARRHVNTSGRCMYVVTFSVRLPCTL